MALPAGWPPRPSEGRRSIRFYASGSATADFADNAYLFIDATSANTYVPLPYVAPGSNTTINLGSLLVGGTPSGTGQDIHDANLLAPLGQQAVPHPMIWSSSIIVHNDSAADLYISFDGTNVHGVVTVVQKYCFYWNRYESGIAVRGTGLFRIEAW